MGNLRIIKLRNPELLKENNQILVRGAWGMVLPDGAAALFEEDRILHKPSPIPYIEYNGHEYKWCTGCKSWLRFYEFYKNKRTSDGRSNYCVDCCKRAERKGNDMRSVYLGVNRMTVDKFMKSEEIT